MSSIVFPFFFFISLCITFIINLPIILNDLNLTSISDCPIAFCDNPFVTINSIFTDYKSFLFEILLLY